MIWLLWVVASAAAAYQFIAFLASWRHLAVKPARSSAVDLPGVSVLKPVRGWHEGFDEALRSHVSQDYPAFEILAGHHDPHDSGIAELERCGVPHFVCDEKMPNGKVGVLAGLLTHARYPLIVVNDADIAVPAGYLRDVTAPLEDPHVGVVTCLYRAEGDSLFVRFEALGVATEFATAALVAPFFGVSEFGFGSTLAFRRSDLEASGGFRALGDYLADDYQLGARIHHLGRRNLISHVVVRTRLHARSWGEVWRHQLRWARTIRVSRFWGYTGLPLTFASLWALLLLGCGSWTLGLALLGLRLMTALLCGYFVLGSSDVLKFIWAVPLRDLYGVAVWVAGLAGNTVEWGGETLRLDRQGRIERPTRD